MLFYVECTSWELDFWENGGLWIANLIFIICWLWLMKCDDDPNLSQGKKWRLLFVQLIHVNKDKFQEIKGKGLSLLKETAEK